MTYKNPHSFILAIGIVNLFSCSTVFANTQHNGNPFSLAQIQKAETVVVKKAHELGRAGSFVVVDRHGEIIASYRMPKALPSTFNFTKAKAQTAVALGVPTSKLGESVPASILSNLISTQAGKFVIFPGGYPIRIDGHLVGALAFGSTIVSLDSNVPNADTPNKDADIVCAKAALNIFTNKKASI